MDPISNFLNQLKTSSQAGKETMRVRFSGLKLSILKVLKQSNYVVDFKVDSKKEYISVDLKPNVFSHVRRISKPGQRIYSKSARIPRPLSGFGLVIVSTPKGVLGGREAKKLGIGGEIICEIW